jgi:hypothetical protein
MDTKIEGIFVTDDVTKLPLDVAVAALEAMTESRDHLTEELSKLRKHIQSLKSLPTLGDLIIEHTKLVGKPDDPLYWKYPILDEEGMIKIPNPRANREWTFRNWEWVKSFCERHPAAYPVFREELNNTNYTWIDARSLNVRPGRPSCGCGD